MFRQTAKYSKPAFLLAMLICVCSSISVTVANSLPSRATSAIHLEAQRDTAIANKAVSLAIQSESLTSNQQLLSAYLLRARGNSATKSKRSANSIRLELQSHFELVLEILQKNAVESIEAATLRLEKHEGVRWTAEKRQMWRDRLSDQRKQNIARLEAYQKRGRFPLHEGHADGAVPIFVDNHDTACAVGHLMRCSGWNHEVEFIAATNLLVYVPDVQDGPLVEWVLTSGLTQKEAALIQPGYSPPSATTPFSVLAGTNSTVFDNQGAMPVFGSFQWGALVRPDASSLYEWQFHGRNTPLINPNLENFGVRTDFGSVTGQTDCDCTYSPVGPDSNILTLAPGFLGGYDHGFGVLNSDLDSYFASGNPVPERADYFIMSFDVTTLRSDDAIQIGTWFPVGFNFELIETQTLVVSHATEVTTDQLFYDVGEVPQLVADPFGDAPLAELNTSSDFWLVNDYDSPPNQESAIIKNTNSVSVYTLIRAENGADFSALSHTVRLVPVPEPSSTVLFTMCFLGCTGLTRRRYLRCA